MSAFELYSRYYNLLYRDKDYRGEADYVLSLVREFRPGAKTLLDLGCGTGRHLALFQAAGYEVEGVDISATMLEQAKRNYPHIPFHLGDARHARVGKVFDVVTSLFHVASYQTEDTDLLSYFATARNHLAPGGIFIFDFWHGPGVRNDPPVLRVKRLEDEEIRIIRIAEPTHHAGRNVVDVNYQVLVRPQGSAMTQEIVEAHAMRYFFGPELEAALARSQMRLRALRGWMAGGAPSDTDWNACIVAERI